MALVSRLNDVPDAAYSVLLLDCPWDYYGSPDKDQAAGKHYAQMTPEAIFSLPVGRIVARKGWVYLWATCPLLHVAIDAIRAWGLYPRGVPFIWDKTSRATGHVIEAQGVRPSHVKPTRELVLIASHLPRGRALPVLDEGMAQGIQAPRPRGRAEGVHSAKPWELHRRIERLHGPQKRLELFARSARKNWDVWGADLGSEPWSPPKEKRR